MNVAFAANCSHQPAVDRSSLVRGIKRAWGLPAAHHMCYQPWLMDEGIFESARHDAYGSLALDPDPELAFVGVRALRGLADFCEGYQVRRLREDGHTWAAIAAWAGVSPQALHKKYAQAAKAEGTST